MHTMTSSAAAVLLVFAALSCAGTSEGQEEGQRGLLQHKIREGGNLLEGHYYRPDLRLGLRFHMTSDSMELETWNRRPLISFGKKMRSKTARLVEFTGSQFLQLHEDSGHNGFFKIRQGNRKMDSSELEVDNTTLMNHTMGEEETKVDIESAVTTLLAMPEAKLIVELAEALGHEKVTGRSVPASLNFYGLALRVDKILKGIQRQQSPELQNRIEAGDSRKKRASWWGWSRPTCRRHPIGSNCLGLCGRGCTCWSWVCGDCCYHEGCYRHDLCCQHSHYSSDCLSLWNFNCNWYSC